MTPHCHHDTACSRLAAGARRVAGTTLALLLVSWLAASSCTETRDGLDTPESPVDPACLGCHGDSTTPAPRDAAHRVHLDGTTLFAPVACESCHVVPTTPSQVGHADTELPAEVIFGGAALPVEAPSPTWDPEEGTCASVACHGAGLASSPSIERDWRSGALNLGACGSCHGAPPTHDGHPSSAPAPAGCTACHGELSKSTHGDGDIFTQLPNDCTACHGDADSPAPVDLVHRAHVLQGADGAAVACQSCHPLIEDVNDPVHLDGAPVEVVFSGVAVLDGASPTWAAGTCSDTYCHASGGGALPAPKWADTSGGATACTACHDDPPAAPHPQLTDCLSCHGEVLAANGEIGTPERHVDGVVDEAMPTDCGGCHGTDDDFAPPDLVHTTHRSGAELTAEIACETCHLVPATVLAAGHVDTAAPAEVVFGGLALSGDATPAYADGACSGTYCHASGGGTLSTPSWTDTSGDASDCAACHGDPPAAPHPQIADCAGCHGEVLAANGVIGSPELHVDGKVDESMPTACDGCHGTAADAAPVDAGHTTHRSGAELSAGVTCEACHLVPTTVLQAGHVDTAAPAEVSFSGLAKKGGSAPTYAGGSCSGTYCHDGGSAAAPAEPPAWGDTSGAWTACDACHGAPPVEDHPISDRCDVCHADVAGPGLSITGPDLHVDGTVQVTAAACDSCHSGGGTWAPDTGAHLTHLDVGTACNQCHVVPVSADAPGHLDTPLPAEVTFGSVAAAGSGTPTWTAETSSCSNTWCHSPSEGAAGAAPTWDDTSGAWTACDSCHGAPPETDHPPNDRCDACHATVAGAGLTIIDDGLHVDGTVQYTEAACDTCHGGGGTDAPDTGAHLAHIDAAIACTECHTVPAVVLAPGHVDTLLPAEVTFGTLAQTGAGSPTWDTDTATCSNTWCHDSSVGAAIPEPLWTDTSGAAGACGGCHGVPPEVSPHDAGWMTEQTCAGCHSFYPDGHLDGVVSF